MSSDIPPWNPVQFIIICTYTCFLSFFHTPSGGLQIVAVYVSVIVLAIPATFVQLKLGGYLQKGVVGAYSIFFPIWKGVGISALFDLLLLVATYAPLVAHLGTYAFIAISSEDYTWGSCDLVKHISHENEVCVSEKENGVPGDISRVAHRPEELFYKHEFLQLSPAVDVIDGFPQWRFTDLARKAEISLMPVTLAIVWVLVSLFVGFGPRICGWILFLLGPAAVLSLLTVLGYGFHHLDKTHSLEYLKQLYMFKDSDEDTFQTWLKGFHLLMYTFPMWTAICCTMGKFCGRSRKIRNL
ncbi:unnamed protein product [Candidula unifasciata]|uniref:Uncharacterized protein n=1 Tax=Candidula unifasciata TaxID=100452 RepID=A0A8S3Z4E2_9EUPU|nr:unnamed protein product [Candidula unifasciata]